MKCIRFTQRRKDPQRSQRDSLILNPELYPLSCPLYPLPVIYLGPDFFSRDTLEVARDLVGVTLVANGCEGRIVETEAYTTDLASHSVIRKHKASAMRDTFGHVYVYFIYGMYYCLNFTTDANGTGAVLIRAAEPLHGLKKMIERRGTSDARLLARGPGRLCQAFGIDLAQNGERIGKSIRLKQSDHSAIVKTSRRIGITRDTHLEWRFFEDGNRFVTSAKTGYRGRIPDSV